MALKSSNSRDFSSFSIASPEQMRRRKIVKKGFKLCLMVCGRCGTGKSTFINTLCDGQVFSMDSEIPSTTEMEIHSHPVHLDENDGTTITLTVVDTPGFGDNIDNNECCGKIVSYLEHQFDKILEEESRVQRNTRFEDKRAHVCLYFITPTGHGLQELDIDLMMKISARVNVIPVISKADTLTPKELVRNKQAIIDDIRRFRIPIYYFPCDPNDEESMEECAALKAMVPFSIVGSNSLYKLDDEFVRGRRYPWGFVKIEDPDYSDFVALRSVLFGSHLQELRDLTHDVLYERYRTQKLSMRDQENASVTDSGQGYDEDVSSSIYPLDNDENSKRTRDSRYRLNRILDEDGFAEARNFGGETRSSGLKGEEGR